MLRSLALSIRVTAQASAVQQSGCDCEIQKKAHSRGKMDREASVALSALCSARKLYNRNYRYPTRAHIAVLVSPADSCKFIGL
jgi:hypothetical protein